MNPSFFVVDDSRAIQAIIRRSIEASGYAGASVQIHTNAEDALSALETVRPDLLITDWHMPGMTGMELLQTLRQLYGRDIKVGMITTEASPDLLRSARDQGVEFILSKPFSDAQLRQGILDAIGPPGGSPAGTASAADLATGDVPAAAGALADAAEAEATQALRATLASTLGPIKFRLLPCEAPGLEHFAPQLMLVLYSLPSTRKPYALGLLDLASVCMIGGGGLGLLPDVVRPATQTGSPSAEMVKRASAFMQDASRVVLHADGQVPQASRGATVARELDRLCAALLQHTQLLNYRLHIPGYGEGRISFLVL